MLAADHATLVLREGKRLRAIAVSRSPDAERDPEQRSDKPSRKSGWIDLAPLMSQDHVNANVFPKTSQYYTQYNGKRGTFVALCVIAPMWTKRLLGNEPPKEPTLRVYGARLLFDRDADA